jgi:aspartyl-tRNA(Asn)/glutamyl-tRNA(Gln) amidotransferase subunit C
MINIQHVAKSARLNLTKHEKEKFEEELKEILKAFQTLDEVNEKPTFQPVPIQNIFREDKVGSCLKQSEALFNAENKEKGFFKGPRAV